MLEVLQQTLRKNDIKNAFLKTYIIWNDFIGDNCYLYNPNDKSIKKIENNNIIILKKCKIKYQDMDNSKKYLIIMKNLFNGKFAIGYFTKKELDEPIKILRIKV